MSIHTELSRNPRWQFAGNAPFQNVVLMVLHSNTIIMMEKYPEMENCVSLWD